MDFIHLISMHSESGGVPWFICEQSPLPKEVRLEKHIYSFAAFFSLLRYYSFALLYDVEFVSRFTLPKQEVVFVFLL